MPEEERTWGGKEVQQGCDIIESVEVYVGEQMKKNLWDPPCCST